MKTAPPRFILLLILGLASFTAFAQDPPPAKEMVIGRKIFHAFSPRAREDLQIDGKQWQKILDAFEGAMEVEGDSIRVMMVPGMDFDEMHRKAHAVLKPEQQKRLTEIWIQIVGAAVVADEEIAKSLELTDEQKKSVAKILEGSAGELMGLFMEEHSPETAKKAKQIRDAASAKALVLLTEKQKAAFEQMKGKPFKLKSDG
jgi:hypothetical protein